MKIIQSATVWLLFVIFVAFFTDAVSVEWKRLVTTQMANRAVQVLNSQGGITTDIPQNFPGKKYITSKELYKELNDKLVEKTGLNDVSLTLIQGSTKKKLTENTNFKIDYMENYKIVIEGKYSWGICSVIFPSLEGEKTAKTPRNGKSEYKYNYDKWEEEQ